MKPRTCFSKALLIICVPMFITSSVLGMISIGVLTKDAAKEKYDVAKEAAKEKYDVAKDKVRYGYDKAKKDLDHLTEDVNEYVRDNPGKSVLMAAGIGFVLGLLLRGRRD